jgi:sugar O-acyltransferase (sialic acid O-acetyltransferase NeuD family)
MTDQRAAFEGQTTKLAIFGAGGHGRELANLALRCGYRADQLVFLVDEGHGQGQRVAGIPVETIASIMPEGMSFVAALGDPSARRTAVAKCLAAGMREATLADPAVALASTVTMGPGSIIAAGSVLTVDIELGSHVHINVGCTVSHDVRIGSFGTLSPGVHIAGRVHIGEGVFVGVGASILPGTSTRPLVIGDGAVIGAGACVTNEVDAGTTVAGVPARVLRPA